MTAPAAATRQTPGGKMLADGYQSLVTCALDPDISLWEKEVTPPAIEADDFQEVAHQQSVRWRMKSTRSLLTLGDLTFTAHYDPAVYNQIRAIAGINTTWTVHFPDHATLAFYGGLKSFTPAGLADGTVPEATCVITPTNMDPTTCTEEGYVYAAGGGTGSC